MMSINCIFICEEYACSPNLIVLEQKRVRQIWITKSIFGDPENVSECFETVVLFLLIKSNNLETFKSRFNNQGREEGSNN